MAFLTSFAIFALILALIRLRILNEVDQSSDSYFLIFWTLREILGVTGKIF